MKHHFATLLFAASSLLASIAGTDSEPVFSTATLPAAVGDHFSAYAASDVAVSPAVYGEASDQPQTWDFSADRASNEAVWRYDIVGMDDVPNAHRYPDAAYAERLAIQGSDEESWEVYGIVDEGRAYYGLVAPPSESVVRGVVFDPVTIDLPKEVRFGDKWDRTLTFADTLRTEFGDIDVFITFTANASVDAHGTLILPKIGPKPAIRVNELRKYETLTDIGIPLPTQYFRGYYWLVPGIGKAVDIGSAASGSEPSNTFTTAASVERVFESSLVPLSVRNLKIQRRGEDVFVSWSPEGSGTMFTIAESHSALATATEWKVIAETSDTFFFQKVDTDAVTRFFCVSYQP